MAITNIRITVSKLFCVICPFFLIYSQVLLQRNRNERSIKKRSIFFIRLATVGGWLATLNLIISIEVNITSCFIFYVCQLLIAPLSIGPQLLRSIRLWSMMKLQFLILTQEKLKLRKRPDKTMKRKTTLSDDQKDRVAKQVQTALEVSKVKRRTEFLMWLVGVGLIVLPTLILIIYSLVKAENDNPGILLEKDFQACLPEPDSILYVSPIIGLVSE